MKIEHIILFCDFGGPNVPSFFQYGFFSRRQHERLKELQEQVSDNELEESECAPSTAAATGSGSNDSTRELLFEDSD